MKVPNRILCEGIDYSLINEIFRAGVLKHKGQLWSANSQEVKEYRSLLLDIQNYRCVYCQSTISGDANGLRELDHILPKNGPAKCNLEKIHSSYYDDRYHTLGYPQFVYEPQNLAVACKQCNTNKSTFDSLFIRDLDPTTYPTIYSEYIWVHPYFHKYSEHICITRNWLYEGLSHEGKFTIRACKLDKSEVLARRKNVEAYAKQSHGLVDFVIKVFANRDNLAPNECVNALYERFELTLEEADKCIEIIYQSETPTAEDLSKLTQFVRSFPVERKMH